MSPLPTRPTAQRNLLTRILDQPNLVAAVQALPAQTLGKLIDHVGLEDAGEIVALATTEQLKRIFDEDLWRSERPGKDEAFDAKRFALWLEIMLEAGEEFAAQKLAELPEDLVTLALHKNVLVINIEEMAIAMSARNSGRDSDQDWDQNSDDRMTEKALESCLCEEIAEYRIISRKHEGWDAILTVLLALDRDHPDFLARVLEHCCHAAAEYIEDNGGLYQVLTSDEMLESDVGAEREERRAEEGFISPSSAASFLALARTTELAEIIAAKQRDPVTHAYFRSMRSPTGRPSARTSAKDLTTSNGTDSTALIEILREAEVLPTATTPLLLRGPKEDNGFAAAMHALRARAADIHAQRMQELAYLANVLAAGCSLEGRAMRPLEAAHAAVAACNLGIEHLLHDEPAGATASAMLGRESVDKLFRIGWRLLSEKVVLPAARASGKILIQSDLEPATRAALLGLMGECPSLRGTLAEAASRQGHQFIATMRQLRQAREFLDDL